MINIQLPCWVIVILSIMGASPHVAADEKWICLTNTLEEGQLGSSTACYFSKKTTDGKWRPQYDTGGGSVKDGFRGRRVLCSEVVKASEGFSKCRRAPCCYDGSKLRDEVKANPDKNRCIVGGATCESLDWLKYDCWTWWQSKQNFVKFGVRPCSKPKPK